MRDDIDIEEALKRFENEPGPEVKRSVMARFSQRFRGRQPAPNAAAFWKKPVPLYAAAAVIVVAVGLSFVAGRKTSGPRFVPAVAPGEPARALNTGVAPEVRWEAAPSDLL